MKPNSSKKQEEVIKVQFEEPNRLHYTENEVKCVMVLTKKEQTKIYYGSIMDASTKNYLLQAELNAMQVRTI